MKEGLISKTLRVSFLLFLLLSLVVFGCSTTARKRESQLPRAEGYSSGRYYNFEDVRVPKELNYKPDKSFIYETSKFKAGVLFFSKWRLDVESLIDFFTYNMQKDNWKLLNTFKGKASILNFSKPDKTCVIKIVETWYGDTEVEIQVGPLGERKM